MNTSASVWITPTGASFGSSNYTFKINGESLGKLAFMDDVKKKI